MFCSDSDEVKDIKICASMPSEYRYIESAAASTECPVLTKRAALEIRIN
jgi:hypothetical protein